MAIPFLMLAAMAGSAALSAASKNKQYKYAKRANELEAQQIDLRMKQERLAFEEEGLSSLENLREVMASTQALFAAQGRIPGIGTTAAIERKSMRAFNRDESSRAMSIGFREHYYNSQKTVGKMGLMSMRSQQKDQLKSEIFNSAFSMTNFSSFGSKGGGSLSGVNGGRRG